MTRVVSVGRSKGPIILTALGALVLASTLAGCPGTLDSSQFPPTGGGGTTGTGGTPTGGSTGTAGSTGTGGTAGSCDPTPIIARYMCSMAGCHDATGTSAHFSMTGNWQTKLVGVMPPGGGTLQSMCMAAGIPYIIKGSATGDGLFLKKIQKNPPCGLLMPYGATAPPTAQEFMCFQQWATALANQ